MTQKITAAEQFQNLIAQEKELMAGLAGLMIQVEETKIAISTIRAAKEGAELGFKIAQDSQAAIEGGECQT
ncbi:hypothetical protein [Brevundimonas sp.]|uniref:hypothetical protein n=1 Tax=Brevundimonas sp. TaxID=1871086 RepID=UPI002FC60B54